MKKKMNKKKATLLLLMTGILAASLSACQSKKDDSSKTKIEEGSKAIGSTAESESLGYEAGDSKTKATWYDFTDEEIENVFGAEDLYGDDSYENDGFYSSTDANSDAYIQVLNNYDSFKDVNSGGEDVYLNEYAYEDEYTEDPLPYTINKFTYLDLDEDSENEVVLEMDYGLDGAYAVLKEIDGNIF